MLFNLLPGIREIRAPLISGYLWLVFFFLVLHGELPSSSHPGSALKPLFEIGEDLSTPSLIAVTGIAAYLVGSAMQELWKLLGRFLSPGRPLYGEAGIRTSPAGRRDISSAVLVRLQSVTGQLSQVALAPGERGIVAEPNPADVERELPLIRTLLLGERPELVGELDRLQAEADLRITVAFPLACFSLYLALKASLGWVVLALPAFLLLAQGYQRQLEAGDLLAKALKIGKADAPSLEALSSSAEAALQRVELEAELRKRMDAGDGLAAFQLGNLQASWDDCDTAVVSFEFAVEKGIVRSYAELGQAHESRGDDERAERAYRDGVERRDEKCRVHLAALLRRHDRDEEARVAASEEDGAEESDKGALPAGRDSSYRKRMEEGDSKAALNLALLLRRSGKDREAAEILQRATELDPTDSNAWMELARARSATGLYLEAEAAVERALELHERQLGPDHLDVAKTLLFLGQINFDLSRLDRSRVVFERALDIREEQLGSDHPDVALTLSDLGLVWGELGQFEKAREAMERAIAILRRTAPPDDPHVARLVGNLGWIHRELGHYARCLELEEEALRSKEQTLDPESYSIARTLDNLGAILGDMGEHGKALTHLERAVRILEADGDGESQYLAEALRDMGRSLVASGRPDKGVELCERALAIETERLGPRHPRRALTLIELGAALRKLQKPDLSAAKYREALGILEEHPKRSAVAVCMRGLGETALALDKEREARRLVEGAISIQDETLPFPHPERALSYEALAVMWERLGQEDRAATARASAEAERQT